MAGQTALIEALSRQLAPAFRRAYGELERLQVTEDTTLQADEYINELEEFVKSELEERTNLPVFNSSNSVEDLPEKGGYWLVKAVTGRVNFRRTLERACSQFVYVKNGRPLSAYLYYPLEDRLVSAVAGEGVRGSMRGRPSGRKRLVGGLVRIPNVEPVMLPLRWIEKLANAGVHVRVSGNFSNALEDVAMGRIDGVLAEGISLPSRASAYLFAKEANLTVTDLDGNAPTLKTDTLAIGPVLLHKQLLETVK